MTKVKVLIEGYAEENNDYWLANSTVTFVESNGKKIIVDPGCNRSQLIRALEKNNLTTSDINYVLLTHNHTDHVLLAGIFENAKVLNDDDIYDVDNTIKGHGGVVPKTDLKIIKTPGHDPAHCCVLAKDDEMGTVAIAGDLFWWLDKEEQKTDRKSLLEHKDQFVKNEGELLESREKVLDLADYIIPGHGKMFKVEK